MCKNGVVEAEFLAVENGIIGIAVKYENNKNHYLLEIAGVKTKFIQFKKVLRGQVSILAKSELMVKNNLNY